jgi:UDP-N-acetylglucosamine 2-epimerase (non-hydrolysing)
VTRKLKVVTIVGTRPEIIKLSRVIAALEVATDHVLVHSGQNFDDELSQVFFRDFKLRAPDHFLDAAGTSAIETMAKVLVAFDRVLEQERPDAVLVYGDTNTGIAVLAAKRRKIPIFHMEAGNRCFDQRVPEEINRKIIDHTSDINMPLTEHARRYLLAEGIPADRIIKIGSTLAEIYDFHRAEIDASPILDKLGLSDGDYFLVSAHREENVDDEARLRQLCKCMEAIAETFGKRVVVSTHPRTRKRLEASGLDRIGPLITFLKPFGFFDYVRLQKGALCVVSDSGSITEEAALLDLPAITIRDAHERPEGMDEGVLIMTGLNSERVLQAVTVTLQERRDGRRRTTVPTDYTAIDVSRKVVRIIHSYIDYVRRTVWSELPDTPDSQSRG